MNVNSTLYIVGRPFKNTLLYLKENGLDYLVLRDQRTVRNPEKLPSKTVLCDFTSKESLLKSVKDLPKPDGILVIYENYIVATSWLAAHFDCPGMPEASAKACTDKELMRELFAKAPKPISPAFRVVKNQDDMTGFADQYHFPVILKPANLAKSLLVHKCHNFPELIETYRSINASIDLIYKRYAPGQTPKLIIEQFMEGSIHSVDAFVDKDGTPHVLDEVVDYQTGYDIGYDDNFHYSRTIPSKLSDSDQTALRETAALGCQALGMRSSPAHIEIIMTSDGPKIVEIGARNGGYRERMYALSSGIDITGAAIELALGKTPSVKATKDEPSSVLELFPKISGHFTKLHGEEKLQELDSLKYFAIKTRPGEFVGSSSKGHKAVAIIMLHNKDSAQFNKDLAFINEHVFVETDGAIS